MKIHSLLGTVRIFLRAAAPLALLCALPIHAQEQPPASPDAPPVAPAQEQISLNGDSAIQPASPAPSEIALKNNRLFYVLANYSTVEKHDQFGTLSARTKFKLSVKTMSDPVTVSFLGVIALMGQATNSEPSYGQGLKGYSKRIKTHAISSSAPAAPGTARSIPSAASSSLVPTAASSNSIIPKS